jgi:Peptidase family M28
MEATHEMRELVEFLCSPLCTPRNPGTSGGTAARTELRDRLDRLGLEPGGEKGFDQPIPDIGGSNLLGVIPGKGDRYVLLAAHYDACMDNNPGADDNAAGVAVALEVAQNLAGVALERSVIIALFDAEEPPYFLGPTMGSQWFVDHPTVPLDRIDMMICLDLVGHALGPEGLSSEVRDSVFVLGAEKSSGTRETFDALEATPGIRPRRIDNYIIEPMSDYHAFMNAEVPFLFYSAGRWEHYHASTDTPDRLDYDKMAALAVHLTEVVTAMANRSDVPKYVADAYDDEATISSLEDILASLATVSPDAERASMLLRGIRAELDENGAIGNDERGAVAFLIGEVESALS